MRELQTLGAAGEVTGSGYLLTGDNGSQVLIDFGMFQGGKKQEARNREPLNFNPSSLDAVILTHAHLDHTGNLPRLTQRGYNGRIFATGPTADLARLVLNDTASIQSQNPYEEPLYTRYDVRDVMHLMTREHFGDEFRAGGFRGKFVEAGHILGSASLVLTEEETRNGETIVFSGDLGTDDPADIIHKKQLIDEADIFVMETTYGGKEHPVEDAKEILREEFEAIEKNNGTLLIPTFSIHRAQRLLRMVQELQKEKKISQRTKTYFDSKMGAEATFLFKYHKDLLREDLAADKDLFSNEDITISRKADQRREIEKFKGPKAIIAGAGMMNGGRIRNYASKYLEDPKTRVLLTGYQGEGTLGRQLQEGVEHVRIDGQTIYVNATITTMGGLSAHAGHRELMRVINAPDGLRQVVLVHGEAPQREAVAQDLYSQRGIRAIMPQRGEVIDLRRTDIAQAAD